jgi:hypothetical protein
VLPDLGGHWLSGVPRGGQGNQGESQIMTVI